MFLQRISKSVLLFNKVLSLQHLLWYSSFLVQISLKGKLSFFYCNRFRVVPTLEHLEFLVHLPHSLHQLELRLALLLNDLLGKFQLLLQVDDNVLLGRLFPDGFPQTALQLFVPLRVKSVSHLICRTLIVPAFAAVSSCLRFRNLLFALGCLEQYFV